MVIGVLKEIKGNEYRVAKHSYMIYENGVFTWKNLAGEEYQTWKTVSHS